MKELISISLNPVQQVPWKTQTKPRQLEEEYDKKTEPAFTRREHARLLQKDPIRIYAILHSFHSA